MYRSWKKVAPRLESSVFESEVEKQLEEAMSDHDSHTITVVTSGGIQQRPASTLSMRIDTRRLLAILL